MEKVIATKRYDHSRKDWRKLVRVFRESEFMRELDEECPRAPGAERQAERWSSFRPE
jgi:hypothetical protein